MHFPLFLEQTYLRPGLTYTFIHSLNVQQEWSVDGNWTYPSAAFRRRALRPWCTLQTQYFYSVRISGTSTRVLILIGRKSVAMHSSSLKSKSAQSERDFSLQVQNDTHASPLLLLMHKYWKFTNRSARLQAAVPLETTQGVIIEGNLNACECSTQLLPERGAIHIYSAACSRRAERERAKRELLD